jgi:hypothetical protein
MVQDYLLVCSPGLSPYMHPRFHLAKGKEHTKHILPENGTGHYARIGHSAGHLVMNPFQLVVFLIVSFDLTLKAAVVPH